MDLTVWQKAHHLTILIYRLTGKFPVFEKYRLVAQICRAVSSIPANIAEGYGRSSKKEFVNFLNIARGSAKETHYHLILARDLGYITEVKYQLLSGQCEEVCRMISGLINTIRQS